MTRTQPIETCPTEAASLSETLWLQHTGSLSEFRNAKPGETGDRNVFRVPGYVNLDLVQQEFFNALSEKHKSARFALRLSTSPILNEWDNTTPVARALV